MTLNQWLLFYIPSTPLAILLIGLFLGITVGSLFLVMRFIPFHRLKSHNDVAGFIFSTIGVIYAVLLAFMVIVSYTSMGSSLAIKHSVPDAGRARRVGHIFSCPTFQQRNMLMVSSNVSLLYFYPLKMLGNDKAVVQPT